MVFPFDTTSTKNTTIYETNDCHIFAASACPRSARVKHVESLKIISVDLKAPDSKPPGYKPPSISPPVISPWDIWSRV